MVGLIHKCDTGMFNTANNTVNYIYYILYIYYIYIYILYIILYSTYRINNVLMLHVWSYITMVEIDSDNQKCLVYSLIYTVSKYIEDTVTDVCVTYF